VKVIRSSRLLTRGFLDWVPSTFRAEAVQCNFFSLILQHPHQPRGTDQVYGLDTSNQALPCLGTHLSKSDNFLVSAFAGCACERRWNQWAMPSLCKGAFLGVCHSSSRRIGTIISVTPSYMHKSRRVSVPNRYTNVMHDAIICRV
jgi:hypothetical protein